MEQPSRLHMGIDLSTAPSGLLIGGVVPAVGVSRWATFAAALNFTIRGGVREEQQLSGRRLSLGDPYD